MTDENPRQFLTDIEADAGGKRSLNVTYHLEDSHPIISGVVMDKVLELDGRHANLSDDEWERVWLKCEGHKNSTQPEK